MTTTFNLALHKNHLPLLDGCLHGGERGRSRSTTPSFFFWSHFRLIRSWWFHIIYQSATGNWIRTFPWGAAGCWTAESDHLEYITKWMKVVELDESIYNTIWPLLFCNKNPCCAKCVRSWREKTHIYRVTCSFSASVTACIPIWRKSTHQLHFRPVKACKSGERV